MTTAASETTNVSKQSQHITSITKLTNKTQIMVAENRILENHVPQKIAINAINPADGGMKDDKKVKRVEVTQNMTDKLHNNNDKFTAKEEEIIDLKHLYIVVPKDPKDGNTRETNDDKINNVNEITGNANEEIEDSDVIDDVKHTRGVSVPVESNETLPRLVKSYGNHGNVTGDDRGDWDRDINYRYVNTLPSLYPLKSSGTLPLIFNIFNGLGFDAAVCVIFKPATPLCEYNTFKQSFP